MKKWLRWLFRRGQRGALLLNMEPGDSVVQMTQYREWLVVASKYGEMYFITGDRLASPYETQDAVIFKNGRWK